MKNTRYGVRLAIGLIFIIILGFVVYNKQNLLNSITTNILAYATQSASQNASNLLSSFDTVGSVDANDITVLGNYAYLVTDNNSGSNPEFYIVNITSSSQPTLISSLDIGRTVIKIAVSGNYAYLLTNQDTGELVVVDISNKTVPFISSTFDIPGTANPLSLYAVNSTLYVGTVNNTNAQGREFYILDASSPSAISTIGSYEVGAKVDSIFVRGERAYIGTNHDTKEIEVLNIASSSAITEIASYDLPGASSEVNAVDYSFGKLYALMHNSGSNSDFFVFNTTTSTPLTLVGSTDLASNNSNVKIYGDRAYVSNTGTVKGFSIVDISNPASPSKINQYIAPSNVQSLALGQGNIYLATADNTKELMILNSGFTIGEDVRDLNGDGAVKIVAIGDSNTKSDAAPAMWPDILQQNLSQSNINFTIINEGYGGTYATIHGLTALQTVITTYHPDYVIAAYGTNDIAFGKSIPEIISAYQAMKSYADGQGVGFFIGLTPPIFSIWQDSLNSLIATLNNALIQTFPKEHLIDFFSPMEKLGDYNSEGVHMNLRGQQKRAFAAFRKLLRVGD